jgi:hypothetical protein
MLSFSPKFQTVLVLFFAASYDVGAAASPSVERDVSVATSVYDRLGNLAPYHKAPVPSEIVEDLPADCTVDQVMLVSMLSFTIYGRPVRD